MNILNTNFNSLFYLNYQPKNSVTRIPSIDENVNNQLINTKQEQVNQTIANIISAKNITINKAKVLQALLLTKEHNHTQAQKALYEAFGIKSSQSSMINRQEKISGIVWGLNAIPFRVPIFGIKSPYLALIKQIFNLVLSPTIGSLMDKVLGDVSNQMILEVMPQLHLEIKNSPTYYEIKQKYRDLYKNIKDDIEANCKANIKDLNEQLEELEHNTTLQSANLKFSAFGLGSIERSMIGAIATIIISILSINFTLNLKQNIIIICISLLAILIAAAFSRSTQQRMTNQINLQYAPILIIDNKTTNLFNLKDNNFKLQENNLLIDEVKNLVLSSPLIKLKLIEKNYEYQLNSLTQKIQNSNFNLNINNVFTLENSRPNKMAKLSYKNNILNTNIIQQDLNILKQDINNFELQISNNILIKNLITNNSPIYNNLSSSKVLFVNNIFATWYKPHILTAQLCKLYGISFQTFIASPAMWSIIADVTRYILLPHGKVTPHQAKIIFATGKIISGVMTSLSNMFSSSSRKQVDIILTNNANLTNKNIYKFEYLFKILHAIVISSMPLIQIPLNYYKINKLNKKIKIKLTELEKIKYA